MTKLEELSSALRQKVATAQNAEDTFKALKVGLATAQRVKENAWHDVLTAQEEVISAAMGDFAKSLVEAPPAKPATSDTYNPIELAT